MTNPVPISALFIGLNGLIAFVLSLIVVMERGNTRLWHGETQKDVATQPNYLEELNPWAAFVEKVLNQFMEPKANDDGVLQRKVRAFGNFTEYVPLALLFIVTLELMQAQTWLIWLLGTALTVGRITHAWGLIQTYGPSPGRAIGFFLTWFVYLMGAGACLYCGITHIFN